MKAAGRTCRSTLPDDAIIASDSNCPPAPGGMTGDPTAPERLRFLEK